MGYYNMYSPDEIANIRREQQADAMPSAEEAKAEHRNHLRREGCRECGETNPDKLDMRYIRYPNCKALQTPPDPTIVLCDECAANRPSLREQTIQKALKRRKNHDPGPQDEKGKLIAVTFFECQNTEYVHEPRINDGTGQYFPHPHAEPTSAIRCRCGSHLDEVVYLADIEDEDENENENDNEGER